MGFFSFMTSDTGVSISNRSSERGAEPVYMLAPDGRVWYEKNYEGYGVFGGQDVYELIAELNGIDGDAEKKRKAGIDIMFLANPTGDFAKAAQRGVKVPKFVTNFNPQLGVFYFDDLPHSKGCPNQGYFY